MHLFTRTSNPAASKAGHSFDEIISLLDVGGAAQSHAGVRISTAIALQNATVWACVRILSEIIAQLPLYMQAKRGDQWVDLNDHDALRLLNSPNDWCSRHDLIQHLITWSELRGNGYCFKGFTSDGRLAALLPLQSDKVTVRRNGWAITYTASEDNGFSGTFEPSVILHLRNISTDGYRGLSTITQLRHALGVAIRAEEHGAKLFAQGAQIGKHFSLPQATAEQVKEFRDALRAWEGAANAHKSFVTGGDVKVESVAMTNEDAQFLQTRKLQLQMIAGAFGVPLFLLNDTEKSTTWGTGLEQMFRAFKTASLGPRLSRLTQCFQRELLKPKERDQLRFVFDTDELTMGDFKDRMEGYNKAIMSGVLNPNECREIEGRNPREGGDDYRQPSNILIEGDEPPPAPEPTPPPTQDNRDDPTEE